MSIICPTKFYKQYIATFKYVLPNGKIHGKYIELFMTLAIDSNIYHTRKTTRSYIDGCVDGIETEHNDGVTFTQNIVNLLETVITLNLRTDNSIEFIRHMLLQNPNCILRHTKEYKNDEKDYIVTVFRNGHKSTSIEYKGGIQDGLITTYFEYEGVYDLIKKEVECHNIHNLIGKTRIYDYIKDMDGNLKQYLIYEGDLFEARNYEIRLNGKATTWSLKMSKDKIKYHILQEHTYYKKTKTGYIKDYKNGRLISDIRYDGDCTHNTSDIW